MLYWLFSNPEPATIARTAPVAGSIATIDAVKPGFSPIDSSTARCAFSCATGSRVVSTRRPPRRIALSRSLGVAPSTE